MKVNFIQMLASILLLTGCDDHSQIVKFGQAGTFARVLKQMTENSLHVMVGTNTLCFDFLSTSLNPSKQPAACVNFEMPENQIETTIPLVYRFSQSPCEQFTKHAKPQDKRDSEYFCDQDRQPLAFILTNREDKKVRAIFLVRKQK
jgi:hypothetical protein